MFELCKKVEVYNIENHYHYYGGRSFDQHTIQKLGLNKLKVQPLKSIYQHKKTNDEKTEKKGIKLTNSIDEVFSTSSHTLQVKKPQIFNTNKSISFYYPPTNINPYFQRGIQQNRNCNSFSHRKIQPISYSEFSQSQHTQRISYFINQQENKKTTSRIQRIEAKSKPVSVVSNRETSNYSQLAMKKQGSSIAESLNKNLSETKPPFLSKIQTCCTYQAISSNHIKSKIEMFHQMNHLELKQSRQNSQSKLISISKSVSSLEQTIREKDHRNEQENQSNCKGSHIFEISLSNIFSKQQTANDLDPKKIGNRDNTIKRLNFWQQSDRKTIQSRFSKQYQNTEDYDNLKVEESVIEENNIKQHFKILQSNQIRKKDYIMSQALECRLGLVVTIKQYLFNDMKLISQQLQAYQIIQKEKRKLSSIHINNHQNMDFNVLQLYKVQLSGDCHMLIKQPYTEILQANLKVCSTEQAMKLRNQAKKIAQKLITIFEKYHIYAVRKITTHEFVICLQQIKLHDLSLFKHINSTMHMRIPNKEEIISGLDI